MTFFNKKEDVIELKLTPYGRKLLSHGKLKPEFYAFYDDDILYDAGKAGFSETNSQSKTRILTETPSIRTQHVNFPPETNINTNYDQVIDNYMPKPIGTNSQIEKKTSGWNIIALDKEYGSTSLTSSLSVVKITGSAIPQGHPLLQIPQINLKLQFNMSVGNTNTFSGEYFDLANQFDLKQEGNKFLKLEKEQGVLYFLEENGFSNSDSFEVEVFLYEEDQNNFKKLSFMNQYQPVVNDMFVPQEQSETAARHDMSDEELQLGPLGPDTVEYYLNLSLDKQVPDEDICKGLDKLKESSIYLDLDLKCPDREGQIINIYASTLGDVEECD